MVTPIIAANAPIKVTLEKNRNYFFCSCGRSANQPYCDGSHAGTGFRPRRFTAAEDGDAYLCQCKHTNNQPFCDGSHRGFDTEHVGKPGPGIADSEVADP